MFQVISICHLPTLYIDPVNIPVVSSMMDLTQVFPELGMLAKAIGEECVPGRDSFVEKFLQDEIEDENQGKC